MGQGQFDKECSPFARFAFSVYLAAMLGYNAVTDAKPQPGAAFFSLGGEKGVEDLVKVSGSNPGTVISKRGPDIFLPFLGFDS